MRPYLDTISTVLGRKRTVAIADCVHFCGYRYGRRETNPYEQYARDLAAGLRLSTIQNRFVEYVRSYRPRHLGEALGVELSRSYPLWYLPWRRPARATNSLGWCGDARSVIDIMTYFAIEGIPKSLIAREFDWIQGAFTSISTRGYQPQHYGYITVRELRGSRSAYLVVDGNHRLSAISALGERSAIVKLPASTLVLREAVNKWPLVRAGMMTPNDALNVFDAYLLGNQSPIQSDRPADIIDAA